MLHYPTTPPKGASKDRVHIGVHQETAAKEPREHGQETRGEQWTMLGGPSPAELRIPGEKDLETPQDSTSPLRPRLWAA